MKQKLNNLRLRIQELDAQLKLGTIDEKEYIELLSVCEQEIAVLEKEHKKNGNIFNNLFIRNVANHN